MNPIRRELLNGLFVLVLSTLLSAAIAAFQIKFNLQVWLLILVGSAIALGGYVVFEFVLSAEHREREWLKRLGTPARLEIGQEGQSGLIAVEEATKGISPTSGYTVMYYQGPEGGGESPLGRPEALAFRGDLYNLLLERLKTGKLSEYKRIICFDKQVLASDHELRSGVLRVGEGSGTIDRGMAEHCRLMMETKGCSLYVAPAVVKAVVIFFGMDRASISVEGAEQDTGGRTTRGSIFFSDPPNGEIIREFWQIERATERRMVAVHKIVFPEDAVSMAEVVGR
jgi:hypothetical protein